MNKVFENVCKPDLDFPRDVQRMPRSVFSSTRQGFYGIIAPARSRAGMGELLTEDGDRTLFVLFGHPAFVGAREPDGPSKLSRRYLRFRVPFTQKFGLSECHGR